MAREFAPDLILVSAGFDAAAGDPLGGCNVTPFGYAAMTRALLSLPSAAGRCACHPIRRDGRLTDAVTLRRVVVVLEGGYNLSSISKSAAACTTELLSYGQPQPGAAPSGGGRKGYRKTVDSVRKLHAKWWASLRDEGAGSEEEAEAEPAQGRQAASWRGD